jgi:hypothetical protein
VVVVAMQEKGKGKKEAKKEARKVGRREERKNKLIVVLRLSRAHPLKELTW